MLSARFSMSLATQTLSRYLSVTATLNRKPMNVKKPRQSNWDRQKLLAISMPKHSLKHPDTRLAWKDCDKLEELEEKRVEMIPNEYEQIYVEEFRKYLSESKMIALFHCNQFTYYPHRSATQHARRAGMELKRYSHCMAKAALEGTKWENMLHFWEQNIFFFEQYLIFGPKCDPKKLLQLDKKIPELLLMGAIIEDRFLNKEQIQAMSKMPPIETLHSELSSILAMPAQKTLMLLSKNQQNLSSNLSQYVKDNEAP